MKSKSGKITTKNIPQIRFKGFDDEWEEKKLNEYLEPSKIKNYDNKYTKKDVLSVSGEVGIVNQIEFQGRSFAGEFVDNYGVVETDDIVYTKSPLNSNPYGIIKTNFGKTGIVSTLYAVYKPKKETDSCFVQAYFNLDKRLNDYLRPLVRKGAKNDMKVSSSDALLGNVKFPSKSEQQKIGTFLLQIDSLIQVKTKKLENLKNVKKSLLQKMFPRPRHSELDSESLVPEMRFAGFSGDWGSIKFSEFCNFYSGGTPSAGNTEFYNGDIPFIRSGEIHQDRTELFLSQKGYDSSSAKMVKIGTILFALYGANSGDVSISKITGAINQAILAIIPNSDYIPTFILYFLQNAKDRIVATYLQGGQGNLSAEIVKDITINTPSKEEQQKIGQFFSKYDSLISLQQKEIASLKTIKKSLLQKMFV